MNNNSHYIIVGHDISSNSLGRALSMALVARELGSVDVVAFGHRKLWIGASQFDFKTHRLTFNWKKRIDDLILRSSASRRVMWLSKGISPLDRVARYVRQKYPDVSIMLDIDDDDSGLADSFIRISNANKIRLNPLRRGSPPRIRLAQRRVACLSDAYTFSTHALAAMHPEFVPHVRIPHVRECDHLSLPSGNNNRYDARVGVLGTIRAHKGGQIITDLMRFDRNIQIVTFEDCGLEKRQDDDVNWMELPADTPLNAAYKYIDVAVIPMDASHEGARLQLPAKLVDAMRAGVGIIATPTLPILEIAGDAFAPLEQGTSVSDLAAQIRRVHRGGSGRVARQRYLELLTPEAAAAQLASLQRRTGKRK